MQQRKKRQRIIQRKSVRIKDIAQERCPGWEESERHNWNVRKQRDRGLVIHANVKSTGNKGNEPRRLSSKHNLLDLEQITAQFTA